MGKRLIYAEDALKALDALFVKQIKQFGYDSYEKADEKTQLVCDGISESIGCVLNLPSAQPEQRWIPCDETVEIPDHEVLACDRYGEEILGYLEYADDQWICESDSEVMYDPIAWMEKPEPYAERREDE